MLVKVSALSRTLDGSCRKMRRALAEFRIRGVETNMSFLNNILKHPTFRQGKVTVNFIKNEPELFNFAAPRNRANKLVNFLGEVIVNGNPDVKKIDPTKSFPKIITPSFPKGEAYPNHRHDAGCRGICQKFS